MNKKCPYCEKEYPEVSRYCPYCGSPNPAYKQIKGPSLHIVRQILLFVIGFIGFQIVGTLLQVPFYLKALSDFGSDKKAIVEYLTSAPVSMFVNAFSYCIIFTVLTIVAKPGLRNLFQSFKDKKAYIAALIGMACIYGFNIAYNIFLGALGVSASANDNQSTLNSIVKIYPIISLIVFGIMGPICEELTYRVGLFDCVKRKNRYLAYAVTIVVFTLIHFDFASSNMVNELLNIPFYAAAAFAFTFIYDQYGFAASVTAHITNNLISIIISII